MEGDSGYDGNHFESTNESSPNISNGHDHEVTKSKPTAISTEESDTNKYYHKNEVTVPINYGETDFDSNKNNFRSKEPHYMSSINLNIRQSLENHSNLEDMSKNYRSTSYLNTNDSPVSLKKEIGIQNPAFDDDEQYSNGDVKSTFDHSKPYNGDMVRGISTANNEERPTTEVVNLELINLKPTGMDVTGPHKNGINGINEIPVKKEDDVEIGNPYDEYFVPVNEHRKYMRGEKLYVTVDKRSKKSRSKCLWWTICLCVVVAAVVIGILAAVGAIGMKEPIKEISARHFSGNEAPVREAGFFDSTDSKTSYPFNVTLFPGPTSTTPTWVPSTDTSLIEIPRALETEIAIDNMEYSDSLADKNSSEYRNLEKSLEEHLKNTLFSQDVLHYGSADIVLKVVEFRPGSVIVKYRIGWIFKSGIHNAKDPISLEIIKRKINNLIQRSNGFMANYHISSNNLTPPKRILDLCQIQNNNCEYLCMFDYEILDFICACPEGKRLSANRKNCENENFDNNALPVNNELQQNENVLKELDVTTTLKPLEPKETHTVPPFEPEPGAEPTPEPIPKPVSKSIPESTQELIAEPTPEPIPEPKLTNKSEPTETPIIVEPPVPIDVSHANEMRNIDLTTHSSVNQPEEVTISIFLPPKQETPFKTGQLIPLAVPHVPTTILPEIPTEHIEENIDVTTSQIDITTNVIQLLHTETMKGTFLPEIYSEPNSDHSFENEEATYLEPSTEKKVLEHKSAKMIEIVTQQSDMGITTEMTTNILEKEIYNNVTQTETMLNKSKSSFPNSKTGEGYLVPVIVQATSEATTDTTKQVENEVITTSSFNLLFKHSDALEKMNVVTPEAEVVLPFLTTLAPDNNKITTSRVEDEPNDVIPMFNTTSEHNSRIVDLNHTNQVFQTEHSPIEHNMSPFLPEIENDTLISILHSDENFIGHPYSISETNETKPFNLSNDQLNHTNPFDPNPTDTSDLKVISLHNEENEIADAGHDKLAENDTTINQDLTVGKLNATFETTEGLANVVIDEFKVGSDLNSSNELVNRYNKKHATTVKNMTVDTSSSTNYTRGNLNSSDKLINWYGEANSTTLTNMTADTSSSTNHTLNGENLSTMEEMTLPPEVINNVHSNSYFNQELEHYYDIKQVEFNKNEDMVDRNKTNKNSLVLSTEIFLETTITSLKQIEDDSFSTTTEMILDQDTESIATNLNEVTDRNLFHLETTTIDDMVTSTSEITDETSVKPQDQYQVKEIPLADVTTTEKLFLAPKTARTTNNRSITATSTNAIEPAIASVDEEDLSVEPVDNFNSISAEDQSVMDKFRPVTEYQVMQSDQYDKIHLIEEQKILDVKTLEFNVSKDLKEGETGSTELILEPVRKNSTVASFARCATGQFQCINGTSTQGRGNCIPGNDRCDSVLDCSDGSDEIGCLEAGCLNNFKCQSGQCLKRHLVCDGIVHCSDGSDELNCDTWSCNFDEFACKEGKRCLPLSWKCDGRFQCTDRSDEQKCHMTQCHNNSFHCSEQDSCIPESWRCDGKSDCLNEEDEKLCNCTDKQFKCKTGGGCISKTLQCDGVPQCADYSDEWHCLRLNSLGNSSYVLQIQYESNKTLPICLDQNNWNKTYTDRACQILGYSESLILEPSIGPVDLPGGYYSLDTSTSNQLPLLAQLIKNETGSCSNIATLKCQDFNCKTKNGNQKQPPRVSTLYNKKKNIRCIASLIAPMWALTSFSCVFYKGDTFSENKEWVLYSGQNNTIDNNVTVNNMQIGDVKEIIIHPQAKYMNYEFVNDVALIKLEKPFVSTDIDTVCLPMTNIHAKESCVLPGYKISEFANLTVTPNIHYARVRVINNHECNSTKHYNGLQNPETLCTEPVDSEECRNENGAPLMCFSESSGWEIFGVVNRHDYCRASKHPTVYSSLMNLNIKSWIWNSVGSALKLSENIL